MGRPLPITTVPSHFLACLAMTFLVTLLSSAARAQGSAEVAATSTPASSSDNQTATSRSPFQARYPRYEVSRNDIIDIAFPFTPEFNQTVTVHPDGYVSLNSVGDVYVVGKTVPELTSLIKEDYSKILHDPVVDISLKDFVKPYFIAGGEIGHPGKYDLRDDTTLTQAIAIAGGFTESSKHSQVLLFRRVSDEWAEVKVLDVKKMFHAGNLTEDLHLQPGDMFFVPQNTVSKVRKWIPYSSVGMGLSAPTF